MTDGFPLLSLYIEKFNGILKKKHESLYNKFTDLEFVAYLWLSKWFQTLFTYDFNYYIVTRLWDILICEEMDVIILIAIYIVEFMKDDYMNCEALDELIEVNKNIYSFDFKQNQRLIDYILSNIHKKKYYSQINKG